MYLAIVLTASTQKDLGKSLTLYEYASDHIHNSVILILNNTILL